MQHVPELAAVTAAALNLAGTLARLATDALSHRRERHAEAAREPQEES